MPTKKQLDGQWLVDIYPNGRKGNRLRRKFPTKAEAGRFEAHIKSLANKGEWNPEKPDNRLLFDLCELWHEQHGKHLKDGDRRLRKLELISEAMGNPIANRLTADKFLRYRANKEAEPKTLNNELGYLNAVFNLLIDTEQINFKNPLEKVKPIKLDEKELSYLTNEQIIELLDSISAETENPHVFLITKICLATGCRWGEAEGLHARNIRNGTITFTDTKSKKNRTIPIDNKLQKEIADHGKGQLFSGSISAFRRALKRTTITLPKGQAAHVLRHTFASHFMINGGNILTLQKILGHSSIVMTMRYAHLAPDHLNEAINLNPLKFVDTL